MNKNFFFAAGMGVFFSLIPLFASAANAPSISLIGPSAVYLNVGDTFIDPGATAFDSVEGDITDSVSATGAVNTGVAGSYTVTYSVTNKAQLTSSVDRAIIVSDATNGNGGTPTDPGPVNPPSQNTAPVINIIGANPFHVTQNTQFVDPGATAQDAEEGVITPRISVTGGFNTAITGTYILTYSVTDNGGLTTTATRTIIVDAPVSINTAPTLTVIGANPLHLPQNAIFIDLGATANDAQDGDLTPRISVTGAVNTAVVGTYNLTYSVTDTGGLTTTATRTVIIDGPVIINTSPIITLVGANPLNVTTGGVFVDPGATATDAQDGNLTPQVSVTGAINTNSAGTYVLTYSVTDTGGLTSTVTRTVIVSDAAINTAPVITVIGANPLHLAQNAIFIDLGATATDAQDGDLTPRVSVTGAVNTAIPGTYTLTYSVTDTGGLTTTATRTVIVDAPVVVNIAPTITLLGDNPLHIAQNANFIDPGATATDAQDGNLTPQISVTGAVNTAVPGTYTLTYSVTDTGGLTTTVTRTVIVDAASTTGTGGCNVNCGGGTPNTPPVITILGANPAHVILNTPFIDPGATATDAQDGDLTPQISVTGSLDTMVAGTYTLTYSVTDKGGLTTTATRTVIVDAPAGGNGGTGTITVCFVLANANTNQVVTDAAGLPAGSFSLTLSSSTSNGQNVLDTPSLSVMSFNPRIRLTAAGANDADCRDYTNVGFGTYNYSPVSTTGSQWQASLYNDQFDQPVNSVFDFFPYNTNADSDGVITLNSFNTHPTLVLLEKYTPTPVISVNTPPVITLIGPNPVNLTVGQQFIDPGATATDAQDGDLTPRIAVTGALDTNVVGTYTLTYSVTDTGGLTATVTRTVIVTNPVCTSNCGGGTTGNPVVTVTISGTCLAQTPEYNITTQGGNFAGLEIVWSSTLNGVPTGELNSYYQQNILGNGSWSGLASRPWMSSASASDIGVWTKTASLFNPVTNQIVASGSVSFSVTDCNTAVPAPTASLTVNGQKSITVPPNTNVTYVWSTTNAVSANTSLQIYDTATNNLVSKDACPVANVTGPYTQISTTDGSSSGLTADCQVGYTYKFTYSAVNSAGVVTQDVATVIVVAPTGGGTTPPTTCPAPVFTSALHLSATVGTPFTYVVSATGQNGSTLTYSLGASVLPDGLSFSAVNNTISGIPTVAGNFRLIVTVTSNCGAGTVSGVTVVNPVIIVSNPIPAPTASITVNGQKTITVPPATNVTFVWSTTNAVSASTTLQIYNTSTNTLVAQDACSAANVTGPYTQISTINGTSSGLTADCQLGYTYKFTYSAVNSVGVIAQDVATVIVANSACTSNCGGGTSLNIAPTITLLGAQPLILSSNQAFVDPGAIATDTEDGIITGRILTTLTAATTSRSIFPDVAITDVNFPYIATVSIQNIMNGYPNGNFGPNDVLTRAQAAVTIVKRFNISIDNLPATSSFTDVSTTDPEWKYIEALYRAGITSGCSASPLQYCPSRAITRAEYAVMIVKALGIDTTNLTVPAYFTDIAPTDFGYKQVQLLYADGISRGCSANPLEYCPNDPMIRWEAAIFLARLGPKANIGTIGNIPGTYILTYTVTDSGGLSDTVERAVIVNPSDTVASTTASITVNGQKSITVPPNTSVTFVWSAANATEASTTLQIYDTATNTLVAKDACSAANVTGPYTQIVGTMGSSTGLTADCQLGYTYKFTYTAVNASTSQIAQDVATVIVANPACTSNCGGGGCTSNCGGGGCTTNCVTTCAAPVFTSPLTASGIINTPFSYIITATSNASSSIVFSLATTSLPAGLTFSTTTNTISGTPLTVGVTSVPLTATVNCNGIATSTNATLVITITDNTGGGCTSNCGGGSGGTGCTSNCGGGGGNGPIVGSLGGGNGPIVPPVITTTTTTPPGTCYYLYDYLHTGWNNNPNEVRKLQVFLRDLEGHSTLDITGIYDAQTVAAVDEFQVKYASDIIQPWDGTNNPSGFTYILTKKKVNEIYCQTAFPINAQQQSVIDAYRQFIQDLQNNNVQINPPTPAQVNPAPVTTGEIGLGTTTPPGSGNLTLATGAPTGSSLTQKISNAAAAVLAWPWKWMKGIFSPAQCTLNAWYCRLMDVLLILLLALLVYIIYRNNRNNQKVVAPTAPSVPAAPTASNEPVKPTETDVAAANENKEVDTK